MQQQWVTWILNDVTINGTFQWFKNDQYFILLQESRKRKNMSIADLFPIIQMYGNKCILQLVTIKYFVCLQLKPGCIGPLKNLRRLGLLRIQDFFDKFESYNFTADELDAVFHAIVWPQVQSVLCMCQCFASMLVFLLEAQSEYV